MPAAVVSKEEIAQRLQSGANIWIAVADGDIDRVKFLLEHGNVTPTSGDMAKYTPIHAAASYSRHDLLRYLLSYPGVSKDAVNVRDEDGDTPLYFCEDLATAQLLVTEFGADVKIVNDQNLTPAQKAQANDLEELAAYLASVSGEEPIPRAELLRRIGEEDQDDMAEFHQAEQEAEADPRTDAEADQLMERVEAIMQESDQNGTDPTERLREVIGESLAKQIIEGYQHAEPTN
ncbi:hypothetical protein MPSI1_002698 [Malassezia psittaci]|uniref:Ankyrin n=1 Tax=Malassezia psittaci TaxID=1821823 RepID=A0AAF0FG81_9BASI|nr:hypothetical protein MPSI1_002698 [Malassezia psittaci]